MKRISMVALALAAFFAFSVASASAAQPVFYGVAELGQTVGSVKTSATVGSAFLEAENTSKISCTSGTATGEVTNPTKTTNNVTTFLGCESSGQKCASTGDPEGTIKTFALDGVLGNVTATLPGIRLFAPGEGGKKPKLGLLAKFTCGLGEVVKVEVWGSVIGSLSGAQGKTPAEGKFAASNKLTFAESASKQKYQSFLAGECGGNANDCGPEQLTQNLNGKIEQGGQSAIATLKTIPFASKLGFTK
jgi:hypothetical protein